MTPAKPGADTPWLVVDRRAGLKPKQRPMRRAATWIDLKSTFGPNQRLLESDVHHADPGDAAEQMELLCAAPISGSVQALPLQPHLPMQIRGCRIINHPE